MDGVQHELSRMGTGCVRTEVSVPEKNVHVVPTTGGMPGRASVHKYQQRSTQAALVKGQSDKTK